MAGISASVAVAFGLWSAEAKTIRQEFERRVDLRFELLRANLREYDSALFALRLLVENSRSFSPEEFENAARRLAVRIGGIQAVQWVPLVDTNEMDQFLENARTLVSPDFIVRELGDDGALRPIATPLERPDYAVISYIHPKEGNAHAYGYDIFTAPTRATILRARSQPGVVALSQPFPLVQGGHGVVFNLFLRRAGSIHDVAPEGGDGFLQLVLRLDSLSSEFFRFNQRPVQDTLIMDVTEEHPIPIFLCYADDPQPSLLPGSPPENFTTSGTIVRDLPVGGRLWRVSFRPGEGWLDSRRSLAPAMALFGGLVLTALTLAYLRTLRRQTERVRQEVALRTAELNESRALLDEIIDHNPSIIWLKDRSFRYQLINISFATAYGRPRSELLGNTDDGLHPPEVVRQMQALDARILTTGETVSFEESYEIPLGRRTYLVSKFPIRGADGDIRGVAGIATDITPLREAESERRVIERKLQETQKLESLGVLAGGVAHDFNNILTGILGHANLLRAHLPGHTLAQSSLKQIETAAQRAAELCRQMLAYSGRGRLSVQSVELGELVRDTTALLKLSLSRGARLRFHFENGLPSVVADITQIRQIVMNLVINASEALPDGNGDIVISTSRVRGDAALFSACILEPELPSGDYVCLEVRDTGSGMPPETLARIFDPFFTTKFTGRGLGLAAVLGIVRGHQGALQVESAPGKGTTFRIYFPATATKLTPPASTHPAPRPPAKHEALHILLVDDDPSVLDTTASLLIASGSQVDAFGDGESALRVFRDDPKQFHVAIIDLTMPGIGGAELLRRLRQIRSDLPILVISGYSEQEYGANELLDTPRVAFLAKPFTIAVLRARLADLVAGDTHP